MSVKEKVKEMIGSSLVEYDKLNVDNKTNINQLKFTEEYQNRIIRCMVGEVDDNYIETPETDAPIVKLENSREGLVKVPSIKGKTILVDADGNETDTPAEGCKLVSVGEEEDNKLIILSKNKNLIDKNNIVFNKWIDSANGILTGNGDERNYVDYTKVVGGATLFLSGCTPTAGYEYSEKGVCIVRSSNFNGKFTLNQDTKFIRFTFDNTRDFSNMQLEYSDVRTNYAEFKEHKTEILFNEPLRNIPNGVCDERVGNKLIRRVGRIVFNGNDDYSYSYVPTNSLGDTAQFNIVVTKMGKICLSNRFESKSVTSDRPYEGVQCGVGGSSNLIVIRIFKSRLNTIDSAGFKQWLSENNVEVLYELETPIIEELPNAITLQGFDDTTMYLENKITPTVTYGYNALIPFKEGAITQGKKSEANAQDIDESIVPFMMDIEYQILTL